MLFVLLYGESQNALFSPEEEEDKEEEEEKGGRDALTWSFCHGAEYGSVGFSHHSALKVKCNENITSQRSIVKCADKLLSILCGVMLPI